MSEVTGYRGGGGGGRYSPRSGGSLGSCIFPTSLNTRPPTQLIPVGELGHLDPGRTAYGDRGDTDRQEAADRPHLHPVLEGGGSVVVGVHGLLDGHLVFVAWRPKDAEADRLVGCQLLDRSRRLQGERVHDPVQAAGGALGHEHVLASIDAKALRVSEPGRQVGATSDVVQPA